VTTWFRHRGLRLSLRQRQATRGKISLAESVGRFANAEEGGIVVVGMETKHIPGGEIIRSVRPVAVNTATSRRYRQVIEHRLVPFPSSIKIQIVEISAGHGLVIVSIPPQDEDLKPFLVHGAIVDGRVEGAYISIVRRSGEDSIPITAQQIHSTLAAGRALLRRGHVAPSREQLNLLMLCRSQPGAVSPRRAGRRLHGLLLLGG